MAKSDTPKTPKPISPEHATQRAAAEAAAAAKRAAEQEAVDEAASTAARARLDAAIILARDFLQSVIVVDDLPSYDARPPAPPAGAPAEREALEQQVTVDAGSSAVPKSTGGTNDTSAGSVAPRSTSPSDRPSQVLSIPRGGLITPDLDGRGQAGTASNDLASDDAAHDLNAQVVVDAFTRAGLVCAIVKPTAGQNVREDIGPALKRADIVVLDWSIVGEESAGTSALALLDEMRLSADGGAVGLRLVAIYTGEPGLDQIAERIRAHFAASITASQTAATVPSAPATSAADSTPVASQSVVLQSSGGIPVVQIGGMRIVCLNKSGGGAQRAAELVGELRGRVVAASELPERLIELFAEMVNGLLPGVALASLTALRRNTHRLLEQMAAELDPAYVWHRAQQQQPADAQDHLVDLVSGEIASLLEDAGVAKHADGDATVQWVLAMGRTKQQWGEALGVPSALRSTVDIATLVRAGRTDRQSAITFAEFLRDDRPPVRPAFAATAVLATKGHEAFAARLALKTRYTGAEPRLELGVIVRSRKVPLATDSATQEGAPNAEASHAPEITAQSPSAGSTMETATVDAATLDEWDYWLCVQPRCDSVRLRGETSFPFVRLSLPTGSEPQKFDVIVPNPADGYLRLCLRLRMSELSSISFAPPAGKDAVHAVTSVGQMLFSTTQGRTFQFLGELKPDHAQHVAEQVGAMFSRVGLTESQWRRLHRSKG